MGSIANRVQFILDWRPVSAARGTVVVCAWAWRARRHWIGVAAGFLPRRRCLLSGRATKFSSGLRALLREPSCKRWSGWECQE